MNTQGKLTLPTYESVVRTKGKIKPKPNAGGGSFCGAGNIDFVGDEKLKKPEWLKLSIPKNGDMATVRNLLKEHSLLTVCEAAACPNSRECFHKGTATFMAMGGMCTRKCNFCNVSFGRPEELDPNEPTQIAETTKALKLRHLVVTSVTRDDLKDGGAAHFAKIVTEVHRLIDPAPAVELLIPDLQGKWDALQIILDAGPDVLNHNVETVPSLYSIVRPQAIYERSLELLAEVKKRKPKMITKSGFMLGLGETQEEVFAMMDDLRAVGCDCITIGQYLRPSMKHLPIKQYVHPDIFALYKKVGEEKGFKSVASGPFVRSSYMAADFYEEALQRDLRPKPKVKPVQIKIK